MKSMVSRFLVLVLFIALALPALADTYVIDQAHSSVSFKIRHLMVSKVRGTFDMFEGWFEYTPKKPKVWKAAATISTASINTANEKRDDHLRTGDFFDVEKYPKMEFVSTGVEVPKRGPIKLKGNLTLHGVTKPVTLDLEGGEIVKDPWGNTRTGFSATGKINRKDFGIIWNKGLEAGGVMIGEDVEILIEVEGILQK